MQTFYSSAFCTSSNGTKETYGKVIILCKRLLQNIDYLIN